MAIPDISSLRAIPILHANKDSGSRRRERRLDHYGSANNDDDGILFPLLPNSYNGSHKINTTKKNKKSSNNANFQDDAHSSDSHIFQQPHLCQELIRITRDLEAQLKERLKDASDGAIPQNHERNNGNNSEGENDNQQYIGMHEEFLLRSEAIFLELLSAVQQQQLRKENAANVGSSGGGGGRHENKRARTAQPLMNGNKSAQQQPPLTYYSALLPQLQTLQSMTDVTDISLHKSPSPSSTSNDKNNSQAPQDLTRISVTCLDEGQRSHTWHAELYPTIVLTVDLPCEFVLEGTSMRLEKWWEHDNSSSADKLLPVIPKIQNDFWNALQKYQPLFRELDDLDSHLWILEPSLPARRCSVERRIALWEGGASIVIDLDPDRPRGVPVFVRFLGVTMANMKAAANAAAKGTNERGGVAEDGIVDWRASFADFVMEENNTKNKNDSKETEEGCMNEQQMPKLNKRWSENRSIRENLELWFGSSLPSPLTTEKSDFLVECGICYSHRLPLDDLEDGGVSQEGPLPEAKCNNSNCNRHYHESCLFEWLHSLPTARVSFDRIFGACPYCCEVVSVKINK